LHKEQDIRKLRVCRRCVVGRRRSGRRPPNLLPPNRRRARPLVDIDGMTIAKANTKVEDTVIKTIVIGDAYLEKGKKDTRRTFLCLIEENGKVVLTFFTDK
jgi:hypothetical protein